MKIRTLGLLGLAVTIAASLTACSSNAPAAAGGGPTPSTSKPVTVRVQAQSSISAEPLYVGIEKGFFKEEGLNVEMVDMPDISAATAALDSGKLELEFAPIISAMTAVKNGAQLTIVSAADGINPAGKNAPEAEKRNYTSSGVYAGKDSGITSIKDLEGKTVGVPEIKGLPDGTISSLMLDAGKDPSKVQFIKSDFVSSLEGLKSGKLDAAFLVNPFSIAADQAGLLRILNPTIEFFPAGFSSATWTGSTKWVTDNPQVVQAFQRAMVKSATYANKNLDEIKAHVITRAGLKLTPQQLPQSYFPTTVDAKALDGIKKKLIKSGFYDEDFDTRTIVAPQPK